MTIELLVPKPTRFERAQETTSGERWPLADVSLIAASKDPWRAPAHLLNNLAYDLSVDLWDKDWPELKKRSVIAASLRLHRLKGTEQGLAEAIDIAAAELVKTVVPPSKFFLSPKTTPEQRARFLASHPQLRIYPRRDRGTSRGFFPGTSRAFAGAAFALPSEAFFRAQPRAFIWRNGVETELTVLERRHSTETLATEERLDLRERGKGRLNQLTVTPRRRFFALNSSAPKRIFSIHTRTELTVPGKETLARRVAHPSMAPIDVVADMVRQPGHRRLAVAGRFFPGSRGYLGAVRFSTARERVYRRTYLYDPDVPAVLRGATSFLGHVRLGIHHHTAELTVKIRYPDHPFRMDKFLRGFLMQREKKELNLVKAAIKTHKRLSDRLLLSTTTVLPVTAGNNLAGLTISGQLVEGY